VALRSRLGPIAAALNAALDDAVAQAAQDALVVRNRLVPVDTGALKASGQVVRVGPARYRLVEGTGLPDARARYTEYGTATQAAQPHMTPAAEQARAGLPKAIAAIVRTRIR
jgi:hypothetical protein